MMHDAWCISTNSGRHTEYTVSVFLNVVSQSLSVWQSLTGQTWQGASHNTDQES